MSRFQPQPPSNTIQAGAPPYGPPALHQIRVCPDCAGPIVRSSGCIHCTHCGWGRCG